jgi:lysophospholipase L1-like esterase
MTIAQAAGREKPRYLVMSFGVNGIVGFFQNEELYRRAYGKLITAIHEASPDTVVLLQTVYPVADNQTAFGQGAVAVNGYIRRINEMLPAIAAQYDAYVVDTASVLYDERGNLRADDQAGDGIHLSAEAYRRILHYLRTHGYEGKEWSEE